MRVNKCWKNFHFWVICFFKWHKDMVKVWITQCCIKQPKVHAKTHFLCKSMAAFLPHSCRLKEKQLNVEWQPYWDGLRVAWPRKADCTGHIFTTIFARFTPTTKEELNSPSLKTKSFQKVGRVFAKTLTPEFGLWIKPSSSSCLVTRRIQTFLTLCPDSTHSGDLPSDLPYCLRQLGRNKQKDAP